MSAQEAFDLAPKVERLKLMCDKCTYVYNAPEQAGYYELGGPDRMCRSPKKGSLVAAPLDSVPGTYYDKSRDPQLKCQLRWRGASS